MKLKHLVLLALFASAPTLRASQPAAGPELALTAEGRLEVTQVSGEPLLLWVTLANGQAASLTVDNLQREEIARGLRASDDFRKLPAEDQDRILEEYAPQEIPVYAVGSASQPVATLIRVSVEDDDGKPIDVTVRALASSSELPPAVTLDGKDMALVPFGIDAEALAGLAPGRYALRARVDSSQEAGMWQGRLESPALTLNLIKKSQDALAEGRVERLEYRGSFLFLDQQYTALKEVAEKILGLAPDSIQGRVFLGDALDGLGESEDAFAAFLEAFELYRQRIASASGDTEPPTYIETRILEIQEQLGPRPLEP